MKNLINLIPVLVLLLMTGSVSAKKYNLEYHFKPGQSVLYHLDLKQNNTYIFQGIGEKNRIHLTFDLYVEVADKTKEGNIILNISIPMMVCDFFSGEQSISRINTRENTKEAGMLRRMINQDMVVEISTKGKVSVKKGLESFIQEMDISHSMKGILLHTFSKQGFTELAHYLFPEYPDIKLQANDGWQTASRHFGSKNQKITTNYVLTEVGDALKIKSADYIENQKTTLNLSGSEFKLNLMGSSDSSIEIDSKTGWLKTNKVKIKQISEDKSVELITNLKISK